MAQNGRDRDISRVSICIEFPLLNWVIFHYRLVLDKLEECQNGPFLSRCGRDCKKAPTQKEKTIGPFWISQHIYTRDLSLSLPFWAPMDPHKS